MKINELAKRTGLKQGAIRFYEERGLINPEVEERNGKLWRNYSEKDLEILKTITRLRRALFSVEQIKVMLDEPALIAAIVDAHAARVDEMAVVLGKLRVALHSPKASGAASAQLLGEVLSDAAEELPMPQNDYKPRFREIDARERELHPERVRSRPKVFTKGILCAFAAVIVLALCWIGICSLSGSITLDGTRYVLDVTEAGVSSGGRKLTYAKDRRSGQQVNLTINMDKNHMLPKVLRELYEEYDRVRVSSIFSWKLRGTVYWCAADGPNGGVMLVTKNDEVLERVESSRPLSIEPANEAAAELRRISRRYLPGAVPVDDAVLWSAVIVGLFIALTLGYRGLFAPTLSGLTSDDPREQLEAYGLIAAAGQQHLGQRHTALAARSSPLEITMALKMDKDKIEVAKGKDIKTKE